LCDDIDGRAKDEGEKSVNVTESDVLAGCNKSRDKIEEEALSCGLTSWQSPGRRPRMIREQPGTFVTLPAMSRMIRTHLAFGPGWNKIFNITGVFRGGIALPLSSLALPGTPELHQGGTVALLTQTGDNPGNDIAGRATVEPR
jgi:hypothetical protein